MALSNQNKKLWNNYEKFGRARGRLVAHILSRHINLDGAQILDFGCGTGGISIELADQGATVTALDTNVKKIAVLQESIKAENIQIEIINELPEAESTFDAIIVLDVIEHLLQPKDVLKKLYGLLKPNGVMYLSTPNKLSFINFFIDPHFSLPIVSILKRKNVKRVLADWLKWQPKERIDFPELMSLKDIDCLMNECGFAWHFVNSRVAEFAFENPESVWNRNSHLAIIRSLKKVGMTTTVQNMISNNRDFFNNWLNPTWYIMAQKKPDSESRNRAE